MRPGKLFRIKSPTYFWPTSINRNRSPRTIRTNVVVLVIDVNPKSYDNVTKFYDLHNPWLVLVEDRPELIDINNKSLLDVTPFIDKDGNSYILDYFLE